MHLLTQTLATALLLGGPVGFSATPHSSPTSSLTPLARTTPARGDEVLLVRAGRLHVRPGMVLEDAAVLIADGVILAVGTDVKAPEGTRVIEGDVVCAGFIDPWSILGLDPMAVADTGTNAATNTWDAVDPYVGAWYRSRALRAGVTTVRVQAGGAAEHGGLGAIVSTAPGTDLDDLVLLKDANLAVAVGLPSRGRTPDVFSRIGQVDKLVSKIKSGRDYAIDQTEYTHALKEWEEAIATKTEELEKDFKKAKKARDKDIESAEEKGKEHKEKSYKEDKKPRAPKPDAQKDAFARVANGQLPLVVTINRAAELRALLAGTAQFKRLRLIIAGGAEAETVAEELAERGIPVVVQPIPMGVNRSDEMDGHDLSLAARLADAGVTVLLGTGGSGAQDLPLLASLAIGHGLDRETALAAMTLEAARAFDLSGTLGSLRPGRRADLLVLDGEPLLSTTSVRYVLSEGRVVVSPDSPSGKD